MKLTNNVNNDFKANNSEDTWYDIIEDYGLIEASFLQQYGIRLRTTTDMSWSEFTTLLAGIDTKTPLGNIVSIRSENNKDILEHFTPEQKRIRREWRSKMTKNMSKQEYDEVMNGLKSMFMGLAKK